MGLKSVETDKKSDHGLSSTLVTWTNHVATLSLCFSSVSDQVVAELYTSEYTGDSSMEPYGLFPTWPLQWRDCLSSGGAPARAGKAEGQQYLLRGLAKSLAPLRHPEVFGLP